MAYVLLHPSPSYCDRIWVRPVRLDVRNISEIEWDETALDRLVIPNKDLLLSQLAYHRDHSLGGERKGLVSVLHGPSGVGKTFCVKAVSEYLQRPLYRVDSADLVLADDEVDAAMADMFNDAARWNAVLVFDRVRSYLTLAFMCSDVIKRRLISPSRR